MKYLVIINEQAYTVEIIDLHERPIRVLVEGEGFDVWPEGTIPAANGKSNQPVRVVTASKSTIPDRGPGMHKNGNEDLDCIKAPIPGVILSLAVRPGDEIQKGQELCVLEAMKMKNLIRSPRDGMIAAIHVAPGQNVSQGEMLIEFGPGKLAGNGPR